MILNKETLDKIAVDISNSFMECETATEVCQLYAFYQNLLNEQSMFILKKQNIEETTNK